MVSKSRFHKIGSAKAIFEEADSDKSDPAGYCLVNTSGQNLKT